MNVRNISHGFVNFSISRLPVSFVKYRFKILLGLRIKTPFIRLFLQLFVSRHGPWRSWVWSGVPTPEEERMMGWHLQSPVHFPLLPDLLCICWTSNPPSSASVWAKLLLLFLFLFLFFLFLAFSNEDCCVCVYTCSDTKPRGRHGVLVTPVRFDVRVCENCEITARTWQAFCFFFPSCTWDGCVTPGIQNQMAEI